MSSDTNIGGTSLCKPQNKSFINELPNELLLEIFSCGAASTAFVFRVSTTCKHWRDLAINSAELWTSLTIDITIPPLPTTRSPLTHFSTVFPKEYLILKRSSNLDVDITISKAKAKTLDCYEAKHFQVLSYLLSTHAQHIRTLDVHVRHDMSASTLFSMFHRIALPRLQKLHVICDNSFQDLFDHDEHEEYEPFASTHGMLEYPNENNDTLPISADLQQWSASNYPMLADVTCSGIASDWRLFSLSNLQALSLRSSFQKGPSLTTLRGILSNSAGTLETLELANIIDCAPSPSQARLTLPRVHTLIIGEPSPDEVQFTVQAFAFPALRNLVVNCPLGGAESGVFASLIRYLPLDELHTLNVPISCFREPLLPDPGLVRQGKIAEGSLPLMLQFIRRLTSLRTLDLMCFCDTAERDCSWCGLFLKFMNYPVTDLRGERNGALNFFGLQRLSINADRHVGPEVLAFLRTRKELGTVDGKYVGPIFEKLTLSLWFRTRWNLDDKRFLEDTALAKEHSVVFI